MDGESLPFDSAFEHPVDGFHEIVAMELGVKAHQIGPQHAREQFTLPGANAEGFRVRPGNVPENSHPGVRAFGFDHFRKKGEVVVLDQHARFFNPVDFLQNGGREFLVDGLVGGEILGSEQGTGVGDVTEGPETFVREPVVVAVFLLLGDADAPESVKRIVGRHAQPVLVVHGFPVGVAGPVGHPGAARRAHHGVQRRHQSAGGHNPF